jgi:hypothetical protein
LAGVWIASERLFCVLLQEGFFGTVTSVRKLREDCSHGQTGLFHVAAAIENQISTLEGI